MAIKIGDLYFDVSADTSGARQSIEGIGGAALDAASLIGSAMSAAFDTALFAAKTATALIINEVISVGAAFNIAGQQAVGLFTALTGSAEEAVGILRDFSELSLDQPLFDVEALQKTTSLLLTFQVAKEDALELAENINLAAIALGRGQQGATQLARAIGQIQGRGWLEGDEARQLSEVGVNAYAIIAEALGKTTGEVIELGRQGMLLAEDVIPILNDALAETFGPVAQNMLNTFGVQAQGIENIITGIGSALVEPFIGRTGGGALTEFLTDVRTELLGVIDVAEDGSYQLTGVLAPLTEVTQALADGFSEIGAEFINFLSEAGESGAITDFASGLADFIPDFIDGLQTVTAGVIEFGQEFADAIGPALPGIQDTFSILLAFGTTAIPIIADGFISLVSSLAQLDEMLRPVTNTFLTIAGGAIVTGLTAVADALELISSYMGEIASGLIIWASWKVGIGIAALATQSFVSITLSALSVSLLTIAAQAGLALAALGSLKSADAAIQGDIGYLNEEVPFYERPFQQIGRIAFAATGGDRGLTEITEQFETGRVAAESFNLAILEGASDFEDARNQAKQYGISLGLNAVQATDFANVVALAWERATAAADAAEQAARRQPLFENQLPTLDDFIEGINQAADGLMRIYREDGTFIDVPMIEEAADLIKLLEGAADAAWESLERLFTADAGATIDDFLRELPDFGKELTEALNQGGNLGDLNTRAVLNDVSQEARDIILTLTRDYGLSLEEIKALFDERGLAGIIQELGLVTGEAAQEVDPLIAKYGDLGFEIGALETAVTRLDERRLNALDAQINEVTSALNQAQAAAEDARRAFDEYFLGGTGGLQGAIDSLVLDIPGIGDAIEAGLLKGGAQGEAAVRQALGQAGAGLGEIFDAGLQQGLSVDQIMAQLGPLYGSIQQELGGALNRISTLDWTEGFTPAAAAEIQSWFGQILDPAQIEGLFNNLASTEGAIPGLQAQLDSLNFQKDLDVTFSQEQIQAEIDAMTLEVPLIPEVSPEAQAALEDAINDALNDEDFAVAIDEARLVQDILDAAKEAEDQIQLDFNSSIVFDQAALTEMANVVGGTFAELFQQKMNEQLIALNPGYKPEGFIGPVVGEGSGPQGFANPQSTVNVNNNIQVNGNRNPRATASEVIAASSAAAGSGGRFAKVGAAPPKIAEGD